MNLVGLHTSERTRRGAATWPAVDPSIDPVAAERPADRTDGDPDGSGHRYTPAGGRTGDSTL